MTPPRPVTCAEFDDAVDELAVGAIAEPRRSALTAHAEGCSRCGSRLRELADLADQMLLLAPSVEPDAGFESRVLSRIGAPEGPRSRRRFAMIAAAAAALLVGVVAGVAVGNRGGDRDGYRRAAILASNGASVGTAVLVTDPRPHVLVAIENAPPLPGRRACELELSDGRRVVVGSWSSDEIAHGAWAVGITREQLRAVKMRIVAEDGRVLATAEFA